MTKNQTIFSLGFLLIILLVVFYIEFLQTRSVVPESILLYGGNRATNCEAAVYSDQEDYTVALLKLDSIYDYLDPATYIAGREEGYFTFDTGLSNYSNSYRLEISCTDNENTIVLQKQLTGDVSSCMSLQNGSLLIC